MTVRKLFSLISSCFLFNSNHFRCPAVVLLSCFLFTSSVRSAPVGFPPAFEETSARAKTLVDKILEDIPAAHRAAVSIQVGTPDWTALLGPASFFFFVCL